MGLELGAHAVTGVPLLPQLPHYAEGNRVDLSSWVHAKLQQKASTVCFFSAQLFGHLLRHTEELPGKSLE